MKKSSLLMIAASVVLSSCGMIAEMATAGSGQKFEDGIYGNTPAFRTKEEKLAAQTETQALVEKTKTSQIYLFGEKKDTVIIPQDFSARIQYDQKIGNTIVTVGEDLYPWDYSWNYAWGYTPYSYRSSWYWNTWSFSPWRYHGWHDPLYIRGWYDPWYYGGYYHGWYSGWYDPWYYGGYWGWDPWYSYCHPHYHGWYGGWDPHHGHGHGHGFGPGLDDGGHRHNTVWHGSRERSYSDRMYAGRTSLRGGTGVRSSVSRGQNPQASLSADRGTSGRTPVYSRTSGRKITGADVTPQKSSVRRSISSVRSVSSASGQSVSSRPANYRKPAVTSVPRSSGGSSSSYTPSSSSGHDRSPSFDRSPSSYSRSSSSYSRSSSSSGTRSSSGYSGGGSSYSRSGSGSSGGYSRGGSGGGGHRR